MTNSAQAELWKAYDLKQKCFIALKDKKNKDEISNKFFDREIKITKQITEICLNNKSFVLLNKSVSKLAFCKSDHSSFGLEWIDSNVPFEEIDFKNKNYLVLFLSSVLTVLSILHDNGLIHQVNFFFNFFYLFFYLFFYFPNF